MDFLLYSTVNYFPLFLMACVLCAVIDGKVPWLYSAVVLVDQVAVDILKSYVIIILYHILSPIS